jgi:hypothetical protein
MDNINKTDNIRFMAAFATGGECFCQSTQGTCGSRSHGERRVRARGASARQASSSLPAATTPRATPAAGYGGRRKALSERDRLRQGGVRLMQPVEQRLLLRSQVIGLTQHQPGRLARCAARHGRIGPGRTGLHTVRVRGASPWALWSCVR